MSNGSSMHESGCDMALFYCLCDLSPSQPSPCSVVSLYEPHKEGPCVAISFSLPAVLQAAV